MGLSKPELLNSFHDVKYFDCKTDTLNLWLKTKAIKNQAGNASKVFVVCDENKVAAYYALATGSVERSEAPGVIKKNMPNPIPVLILGRLAVDKNYKGKGIGKFLLKDAMLRLINISNEVGVKAMLVHALSEDAKRFYLKFGFKESLVEPLKLFCSTETIKKSIIH